MTSPGDSYEELLAYVARELPADEAAHLAARLERDPDAARTVHLLRLLLDASRVGADPPAASVAAAKALYRDRVARAASRSAAGAWSALRRIAATLLFDSRATPAFAGSRGAASGYQMTFESELGEIDIDVAGAAPGASEGVIRGQLVRPGPGPASASTSATVAVAAPGQFRPLSAADIDAEGMFTLRAPPGRYDLLVAWGDGVVVLPDVDVR